MEDPSFPSSSNRPHITKPKEYLFLSLNFISSIVFLLQYLHDLLLSRLQDKHLVGALIPFSKLQIIPLGAQEVSGLLCNELIAVITNKLGGVNLLRRSDDARRTCFITAVDEVTGRVGNQEIALAVAAWSEAPSLEEFTIPLGIECQSRADPALGQDFIAFETRSDCITPLLKTEGGLAKGCQDTKNKGGLHIDEIVTDGEKQDMWR